MQRKQYDAAFKARVALELAKSLKTVNEVAADFGVHPMMITKWKKQLMDGLPSIFSSKGSGNGKDKEAAILIASLYQKIGQLEVELDWLKKNLQCSTENRRGMIEAHHSGLSIVRQCDLLGISRSGYYHEPAMESSLNLMLMRLIDEQYTRFPFYGSPRMTAWLIREGYPINHKRVERLMREMGLRGVCPKRKLSKGCDEHKKYPYLLAGLTVDHPDQVWCADITYIRLVKGFVYLVAVMDWYSRFVLSWEISNTLDTRFCMESLDRALLRGRPEIFNTDQGVQFTSEAFTSRLLDEEIRVSMDGRGRAFDNIFIERLWRSVKYEEVYLRDYETVMDAVTGIGRYFDLYNHERLHQSLGYRTPAEIHQSGN